MYWVNRGFGATALGGIRPEAQIHSNTRRAQFFKVDVQTDCFFSSIDEEPLALRDVA